MTGLSSTVVELMWKIVFRLFQILGMKNSSNKSLEEEYQHGHFKILSSTPAERDPDSDSASQWDKLILLIGIYIRSYHHHYDQVETWQGHRHGWSQQEA